jgi:hypothetical protein
MIEIWSGWQDVNSFTKDNDRRFVFSDRSELHFRELFSSHLAWWWCVSHGFLT